MITLPIGVIFLALVLVQSVGLEQLGSYLNFHAIAIVIGGTISIFLFANPAHVMNHLLKDLKNLFLPHSDLKKIDNELLLLAKNRTKDLSIKDELVEYAQDLWKQGVAQELFVVLLSQKRQEIEQKSIGAIQCLKNLSKYPPSLGMAGTVIGVVTLFQSLGSEKEKLGSSLALAMTATFLGLILANGILMPLTDRLQIRHLYYKQYLQNVYQVLLLINQNEVLELIEEEVKIRVTS
jgi:chemotaxis protein MotA